MVEIEGAELVIRSLREHGVDTVFNLPGDPLSNILSVGRAQGELNFVTFRHEQAVAMAAQAYSYVTRRIGVGMVASGPAMTNAITGLATAQANCWPMLLIGGASERSMRGRGDFQEAPQVRAAEPFCKWSVSVEDPRRIPWFIASAIHRALSGRPGPVYLDLPADVITARVDEQSVQPAPPLPPAARPLAEPVAVERAVRAIAAAERPLLIIGKGVAWSDAADEARSLVERLQIPFIPSPMGKGVVPDDDPLCVASARSVALSEADLVVMAGARFNWLFHFGEPPRFAPDVEVVQIDIEPDEIGNGPRPTVALVGDAKAVLRQLLDEVGDGEPSRLETPWLERLEEACRRNEEEIAPLVNSEEPFTNLYRMYREINDVVDRNAIIVADGEATMAISRVMQPNFEPRRRLDAGVLGCMGVGVPYAIGAQVASPDAQVISVNGDYAFGWNGIEIETAVRHQLPIVFIVANNGSVRPSGAFVGGAFEARDALRYDLMMAAFGGHSEHVMTSNELRPALERAIATRQPALVNVAIDPRGGRKSQRFAWLKRLGTMDYTRSE